MGLGSSVALAGLGDDWQPIYCPDAPGGITQQMFPDGQCHPVFAAGDYVDPAAELWRRCLTDPTACQLISGNVPISAQPYQTPQPVTQAQIDASRAAQAYLTSGSQIPAPAVPTTGGATGSTLTGSGAGFGTGAFTVGGTSIPIWMIAAIGGVLLLLAVKK